MFENTIGTFYRIQTAEDIRTEIELNKARLITQFALTRRIRTRIKVLRAKKTTYIDRNRVLTTLQQQRDEYLKPINAEIVKLVQKLPNKSIVLFEDLPPHEQALINWALGE